MKKVMVTKVYGINCDNEMCGSCEFLPIETGLKCKLFEILLDHVVSNSEKKSGYRRLSECIKAEVKE